MAEPLVKELNLRLTQVNLFFVEFQELLSEPGFLRDRRSFFGKAKGRSAPRVNLSVRRGIHDAGAVR
jgi:hypothetical protein